MIEREAFVIDRGARAPDQPFNAREIAGAPGKKARRDGIGKEHPRHGGEKLSGRALERPEGGINADNPAQLLCALQPVDRYAHRNGSAGGVANSHDGFKLQRAQQRRDRQGERRHVRLVTNLRNCEGMVRKVWGDHGKTLSQKRQKVPPGMGGGGGPVQQQENRAVACNLHVPLDAAGLYKAACCTVGPAFALHRPVQIIAFTAFHGALDPRASLLALGLGVMPTPRGRPLGPWPVADADSGRPSRSPATLPGLERAVRSR